MRFMSTRGLENNIDSASAIIRGIAKDGGLYVPEQFPDLYKTLKDDIQISYEKLAEKIIGAFFTDFSSEDIEEAIKLAYEGRFKVEVEGDFLELFHGPTSAFKDAALLFLPQIMKKAKENISLKEDIVILTATSGDTGKAALEGFSSVDGFKVVVYYPKNGVSPIQEKQMLSQEGNNVSIVGIDGNFDDAQKGVKTIFGDEQYKEILKEKGIALSSANSINIGRLVPQIVYYFYGYFQLVDKGEITLGDKINVVVPTGNFGNILAAFYGKKMGLPIDKLICASNENKVLTDFFLTGIYDRRRKLKLTESPSMDILVSSNLERLLFEACGRDGGFVKKLMEELSNDGVYNIDFKMREFMNQFYGDYATEGEVSDNIKMVYENKGYLIDTHTAVGNVVLNKYRKQSGDNKKVLVAATASPFKFPRSICNSLNINVSDKNDFDVLKILSEKTNNAIPKNLAELEKKEVLHNKECKVNDMRNALEEFLGGIN
ncbi:MAG: threonine synthase [Clostridium sp.]